MSERLFCGDCGSPYKRATWNIHGRKQIVWRCINRIEYGTKFCGSSPSIPEEELHRAILKAVQGLAANFTDEVAAQINGILHNILCTKILGCDTYTSTLDIFHISLSCFSLLSIP